MNLQYLGIFIVSLLGFNNKDPVHGLHKKPTREDYKREVDLWIGRNFNFIALAAIIFLLIFFISVCFFVCGIGATESGMMYNGFEKVV